MRRILCLVAAAAVLLVLVGCASGASGASSSASVRITDTGFDPTNVTIKAGGTVTWTNDGTTFHTVTFPGSDSQAIQTGKTYSKTFDTVGTFSYLCRYHTSQRGTVTVK